MSVAIVARVALSLEVNRCRIDRVRAVLIDHLPICQTRLEDSARLVFAVLVV